MHDTVTYADHNPIPGELVKLKSGRLAKILEYLALRSMNNAQLIGGRWRQVYSVRVHGEGCIFILPTPRGANPWKQH